MVTPFQFAAELASEAVAARSEVQEAAVEAARGIEQTWESDAPVGPTGVTSSDPVNFVETVSEPAKVGAAAHNSHFVAYFLQGGTSKMGPKYDFIGAAEPHIDAFLSDLGDVVGLQ